MSRLKALEEQISRERMFESITKEVLEILSFSHFPLLSLQYSWVSYTDTNTGLLFYN
jgi:hypothetical protein